MTKIAYPGSHKDHPPSENSTSGSKNKNTAEIAQGVVKSQGTEMCARLVAQLTNCGAEKI